MQPNRTFRPRELDESIMSHLAGLQLGEIRYFDQIDSTNTEAAVWASQGAPDFSLVLANEQTSGRGRHQRKWLTPPNSALAFSLIIRQANLSEDSFAASIEADFMPVRWTALGAISVCLALKEFYAIDSEIKWPNDVLIAERKTAGILVEGHWQSNQLQGVILGIGINITPPSVPPDDQILFPATCIEMAAGHPIDRYALLNVIIRNIITWRKSLFEPIFIQTWGRFLAFKGQKIYFSDGSPSDNLALSGTLIGLDQYGRLRVHGAHGEEICLTSGELSMRPYLDKKQLKSNSEP